MDDYLSSYLVELFNGGDDLVKLWSLIGFNTAIWVSVTKKSCTYSSFCIINNWNCFLRGFCPLINYYIYLYINTLT